MARRNALDKIRSLRQRHSIRQIGRMLGVNESTVRRALSGQTKKSKLTTAEYQPTVSRVYTAARKAVSREFRQQGIPKLGVEMPPPSRRVVYREEAGPSETVEADIRRSLSRDLFKMLRKLRDVQNLKGEEAHVRILGYGSTDSEYPGQWFWSDWEVITDYTDEEIDEYLESTGVLFDEITKLRYDSAPPPGTHGPEVVRAPVRKQRKPKKRRK